MSGGVGSKLATADTSGGGISPQQQALAQYTMGQQSMQGAAEFGNSGMPVSTGETWAGGVAPMVTKAYDEARMSDADAAALQSAQSSKNNSIGQGIGSLGGAKGGGGGK
jgi:hypothetical protein